MTRSCLARKLLAEYCIKTCDLGVRVLERYNRETNVLGLAFVQNRVGGEMSGWMCGMDGYGVDGRSYVSRYVQGVEVYLDSVDGVS